MAKILVVDDEPSMREFLEILLRQQDHEVVAAADLATALGLAGTGDLDLVISDLRLGSDSGLDLLDAVRAGSPATEVIMITAFATTENAIEAMRRGAYDYVLKPVKVDELKLLVEKALEHRRLLSENRVLRHTVRRRGGEDAAADRGEILGQSAAVEE